MRQPLYISSACAISPQHTFDADQFLHTINRTQDGRLYVIDADYSRYVNPVAIRRMSRIMKMGISAGMKSLQEAGVSQPDAIITGTGKGSVTDLQLFLEDLIKLEEKALNPTYFIQSTYNSINGWIALQTKCIGYNQTYVHRGHSLELSLLDAQLLLVEASGPYNVLVGCFDELSNDYFHIRNKVGYWKKEIPNSLELLRHNNTTGTIGGEGVAFFTVSNHAENAICSIEGLKMLHDPSPQEVSQSLHELLNMHHVAVDDIDLLLCGMNGDSGKQPLYDAVLNSLSSDTTIAAFKHLCGEYETAAGFGLWCVFQAFKTQQIPEVMILKDGGRKQYKYIVILNHYILSSVSLLLLKIQE